MYKCLICDAVFDESIKVCPLCGVGVENFEIVEEEKTEFSNDTEQMFMILGSGAAAVSAAEAIRARNKTCSICILTEEEYLPYNRPSLTKGIKNNDGSDILIHEKEWYDQNNIFILYNKKITAIFPSEHEVQVGDNERYHYDKLIYALGAQSVVPDIPGNSLYGVFTIRSLEDINALASFPNADITHAAVIGGGVLGLETAWMLRMSGIDNVTVLESASRVMPRQLDAESASYLVEKAGENGVNIITSATVTSIDGDEAVTGITLSDGTYIPARIVIISCGVRANIQIAKECGIQTEKCVKVDEHCKTSIDNIYACGDCAEFDGKSYALWSQALSMGEVAGACAAGDSLKFEFASYPLIFHGFNISAYSVGDCMSNPDYDYTVEKRGDNTKIFRRDGKVCGVLTFGDPSAVSDIQIEM
ncbi:MAG: FAD-dependent oxidoreductase [Clostridia bacterium]|nr:FAD-dependent oxidoreductase [Clostridia bacterium]